MFLHGNRKGHPWKLSITIDKEYICIFQTWIVSVYWGGPVDRGVTSSSNLFGRSGFESSWSRFFVTFFCCFFFTAFLTCVVRIASNMMWWNCERFEPRSLFKSRLSLIVQVNVVLNRTVVVDTDASTTCAVVIFRIKVSCITSVDGIIPWLLALLVNFVAMLFFVCQLSCDVIGYEDS